MHFEGDGGPASSAIFNKPVSLTADSLGSLYVADSEHYRVRRIDPGGIIDTVAGNGVPWTTGSTAQLPQISAMTVDPTGTLYIAGSQRVFSVARNGTVTWIAGTGYVYADRHGGYSGPALEAPLGNIGRIAVHATGAVYIADSFTQKVRKITPAGAISLVAGTGSAGYSGDGGLATDAQLNLGTSAPLAVNAEGDLFIGDSYNYRIRKVSPSGVISTFARNGSSPFRSPSSILIDSEGFLYVASQNVAGLYRISPDGAIVRIAESSFITDSLTLDPGATSTRCTRPRT